MSAQQKSFKDKKASYHKSLMLISRDLERVSTWTDIEIKQRTKWLSECFEVLWAVEPWTGRLSSFPSWVASKR
jgi:hypothetical protein